MKIKFDFNNHIIKLCMTGMGWEESGTVTMHLRCFKKHGKKQEMTMKDLSHPTIWGVYKEY